TLMPSTLVGSLASSSLLPRWITLSPILKFTPARVRPSLPRVLRWLPCRLLKSSAIFWLAWGFRSRGVNLPGGAAGVTEPSTNRTRAGAMGRVMDHPRDTRVETAASGTSGRGGGPAADLVPQTTGDPWTNGRATLPKAPPPVVSRAAHPERTPST